MMASKHILFIESNTTGSGMQMIAKTHELDLQPVLFTRNPALYPNIENIECTLVICETNELDSLRTAIANFLQAHSGGTISGITTSSEFYVEVTAVLATELGTPTNPIEMTQTCRNKAHTRQILTAAGLPQPHYQAVYHEEDITATVAHIGLPLIIKPLNDTGSYGVKLCYSLDEARMHTTKLLYQSTNIRSQPTLRAVLCEEYIDGEEFSVETFAWQGNIICIGITQKMVKGHPFFIEYGHIFPAELADETRILIENVTLRALQTIGNMYGPMHTEVRLHSKECVIIEINARLAGGMIPELIWQATGIDLLKNQLLVASGQKPTLAIKQAVYAGIYFLTASATGELVAIQYLEKLYSNDDIVQIIVNASIGNQVYLPESAYDRLGYIIIRNETYTGVLTRMEQIARNVKVITQCLDYKGGELLE